MNPASSAQLLALRYARIGMLAVQNLHSAQGRCGTPLAASPTMDKSITDVVDALAALHGYDEALDAVERVLLRHYLRQTGGNVTHAAKAARKPLRTFQHRLRKLGVNRASFA